MHIDETPTWYHATRKYHLCFPSLEERISCEVVIIGGGFSGIHTALELAEHDITDIVVLEARELGHGGTSRNGGQVMAGIGHDIDIIRRDVGEEGLKAVFAMSDIGPTIMRERIERYGIDADFTHGYGYMAYNARQAKTLREWEKTFRESSPDTEIRYLEGKEIHQILGTDAYHAGLLHMGGGHVHSLNLLLGEAKVLTERYGVRIFENSPALHVDYGDRVRVRTAKGEVSAKKIVWAVDGFNNHIEPETHPRTINVYAYNSVTEPLSDDQVQRLSPIRGAFSDIRPVINYYRITPDNRLMFGSSTRYLERFPTDLKAWNRKLILELFPWMHDVSMDLAWGGPMACSRNLFPQIGTLSHRPNAFYVQGYSGFGVTPSQIICKVLAEGILGGSDRYRLLSGIRHDEIRGKDRHRALLVSLGKIMHQSAGFLAGRS